MKKLKYILEIHYIRFFHILNNTSSKVDVQEIKRQTFVESKMEWQFLEAI
jgi:hypothetical protein